MAPQKSQSSSELKVLEQGNIYFVYRPKVEQTFVNSLDDVQQFYMILSPHGKSICRLITLGEKQLPSLATNGEKGWAFVEQIAVHPQELEQGLRQKTYQTQTRGERHQPTARPVAEGVYDLVRHPDDMRLVYVLELPMELGPVQKQLNLETEGIYILSVKNPETASPPSTGLQDDQQANYPQQLQKQFDERRFINTQSPDFLDYEGTELILIGSQSNPAQEPGLHQDPQPETEATAEILNNLRMRESRHPIQPLFTGEWA